MPEKEKSNDELREMWKDWLRYSKTHGLDRLVISRSSTLKVIWFIALLGSGSLCSFLIARIIVDYMRFEVKTRIREVFVDKVPFPTISVCNLNPMTTPQANDYLRDYFKKEFNMNVTKFADFFANNKSFDVYSELFYAFYRLNDPEISDQQRQSMGQTHLLYCGVYGGACLEEYTTYFDPAYGNCFLINPKKFQNGTNRKPYESFFKDMSIRFFLFVGQSESETSYLYDPLGEKGILVRFQDFDADDIFLGGVGITAGTDARISLNRVEIRNMPHPYSNCVPAETVDTKYSRIMRQLHMPYSRKTCTLLCKKDRIVQETGCNQMDSRLFIPDKPLCRSKSEYQKTLRVPFNFSMCTEHCPIECETVRYETSVSYVNMPTFNNFYVAYTQSPDVFQQIFDNSTNITYEAVRKTLSGGFLTFDEIKYTEIVETENMKFVDLIAAIGGMMGLFLGFSLMVIFEFVELVLQFSIVITKKYLFPTTNQVNSFPTTSKA